MSSGDPVLHLLAGPNGAGKTTLYERVIEPATHLPFVNADRIAAERWPGEELAHGYEAGRIAADERDRLLAARESFVTETVFSHSSKVELLREAVETGYLVTLHVVMVPEEASVVRVANRVEHGGHSVPEVKVRSRWHRLWPLVAEAAPLALETRVYDNGKAADALRLVAMMREGQTVGDPDWPRWAPEALTVVFG